MDQHGTIASEIMHHYNLKKKKSKPATHYINLLTYRYIQIVLWLAIYPYLIFAILIKGSVILMFLQIDQTEL